MFPTRPAALSANHAAPAGPAMIALPALEVGSGVWETVVPAVVIRPMAPPVSCVYQSDVLSAVTMPVGLPGAKNSFAVPVGVMRPTMLSVEPVYQMFPSGPAV